AQLVRQIVEEIPQVVYAINKANGFQVVGIPVSQAAVRTKLKHVLTGQSVAELQEYCRTLLEKQSEMHRGLWRQWQEADRAKRENISAQLQGCALYRIVLY